MLNLEQALGEIAEEGLHAASDVPAGGILRGGVR
jgi:hypothetical protein